MTAVRTNVVKDPAARAAFVQGVTALKAEPVRQDGRTVTTADLGIPELAPGTGPQPLSTYDLFVLWHHRTMMIATPAGSGRNAAHQGPVFLPWHRLMLLLLERNIARVLGDPDFGLPYWDWAEDGELPVAAQPTAPLWDGTPAGIGGDGDAGGVVRDGAFGAGGAFRVRLWSDEFGNLFAVDRPLRRRLGRSALAPRLPRAQHVRAALARADYDVPDWDADPATGGFRNSLEGWRDLPGARRPNLHNRVHVWVGGDMSPATSPNDPVFHLNHCFVDRVWAAWQARPGSRGYRPPDTAPAELFRHRPADPLFSLFRRDAAGTPWLVRDMFDVSAAYAYDSLAVA